MLFLIATPIGNLDNLCPRAVSVLREADVIACEDTRRTRILLGTFDIPRPRKFVSYRQGNEEGAGSKLMADLARGHTVALCSDGGCPAISDPGYRLVRAALEAGHDVSAVPGASAVTTALMLSGLSTSSFTFKGYPPRGDGKRKRFFEDDSAAPHTLVLFESPFRVEKTLRDALLILGDREAAVCIELTKKFERVNRGYLGDLVEEFTDLRVKGEVTIVIAGANPKFRREPGGESCNT